MEIRGEFRIDPGCLSAGEAGGELELVVPYTGPDTTAAALERAAVLTAGLDARVLLVAVHTLPYPVPFVCPSLVHAHLVEQLLELASHCPLAVQPQVILARDRMEGFRYASEARLDRAAGHPPARLDPSLSHSGRETGARSGPCRPQSRAHARRIGEKMLDVFFVLVSILFFAAGWAFVKGCERL